MTKNHARLNLSPIFCPPSSPSHLTSGSTVSVCSPFPSSSFNPLQTAFCPHLSIEAAVAKLTSHFLISKANGQLWALISSISSIWLINPSFQKHSWSLWPQVLILLWPLFIHLHDRLLCLCLSSFLGPPHLASSVPLHTPHCPPDTFTRMSHTLFKLNISKSELFTLAMAPYRREEHHVDFAGKPEAWHSSCLLPHPAHLSVNNSR